MLILDAVLIVGFPCKQVKWGLQKAQRSLFLEKGICFLEVPKYSPLGEVTYCTSSPREKKPSASFQLLLCWHEKFEWCRGKWCNFRATVCYYCSRTINLPLDILKESNIWGWFPSSGIHDLKLTKIWTYFSTLVVRLGELCWIIFFKILKNKLRTVEDGRLPSSPRAPKIWKYIAQMSENLIHQRLGKNNSGYASQLPGQKRGR